MENARRLTSTSLLIASGLASAFAPGCGRPDYGVDAGRNGESGAYCNDGIDNDVDGVTDCAEPECAALAVCTTDGGPSDRPFVSCEGFVQEAESWPVDIVWVIDNSGSMSDETALVQENMNRFVLAVGGAGTRVAVLTQGALSVPAPLGTDPDRYRLVSVDVQSTDSFPVTIRTFPRFSDFLRVGVPKHFVFVTDDQSEMPWEQFKTEMEELLGSEFKAHAIVSPPTATYTNLFDGMPCTPAPTGLDIICTMTPCMGPYGSAASGGPDYYELAEATGGSANSICEPDWSATFAELARTIQPLPCEYQIPAPPEGTEFDRRKVNFRFTPDGGEPQNVPYVGDDGTCPASGEGWYYDDPLAPTVIRLCETSCQIVSAEAFATVEVQLGCDQTIL